MEYLPIVASPITLAFYIFPHIDHIIYILITYFLCYLQSSGLLYCVTRTRMVSAGLCLRWCATPLRFPPFLFKGKKNIISWDLETASLLV